jgi:hypothetical protein
MGASGCEDDPAPPCTQFEGQCIGVPPGGVCDDDYCTEGIACASIVEVENDDDLAAAAADAPAGTCLALEEGNYGAVTLPGGVSLLGSGADFVIVASVRMQSGSGAVVRGVGVSEGVVFEGPGSARIEAVRITGGPDGVRAEAGTELTVADSEITGSAQHAVVAVDARSLSLERSHIHGAGGPGLWAQCAGGCDCADKSVVSLDHVLVERTHHIGVSVVGAVATLRSVAIRNTEQLSEPLQLPGGGGLLAAGCSELFANGVTVEHSDSFGLLMQSSSGALGDDLESKGIIIVDNKVGIWLSDVSGVTLQNADVHDCRGVGIGIGGDLESRGIIIVDNKVGHTASEPLLVEPATSGQQETVGHGLVWTNGAEVRVDGLALAGNALQSMLIDGPVFEGSALNNVTLSEGDETKGIVQQLVMTGDAEPTVEGGTPAITREPTKVADVPAPPSVPQKL